MTLEGDDLEELTGEIRRLIEGNKTFLEKLDDEEYESEEEPDSPELDDYEEL